MNLVANSVLEVRNSSKEQWNSIIRRLTIKNPKMERAERVGFMFRGNEKIEFYKVKNGVLYIPREFPMEGRVIDEMDYGEKIDIKFKGELYDYQKEANDKAVIRKGGIIQMTGGAGKTVTAISIISELKKKTCVLVHTSVLLNQWKERLLQFTDLRETDIGIIGQGEKIDGKVVLGMVQTFLRYGSKLKGFGVVIADETHRYAAEEWNKVISLFPARYRYGLSATPYRTDGLDNILYWNFGKIIFEYDLAPMKAKVYIIETGVNVYSRKLLMWGSGRISLPKLVTELSKNEKRNEIIMDMIVKLYEKGRNILVLSDRVAHIKMMYEKLKDRKVDVGMVIGEMKQDEREKNMKKKVIVATSQLVKEGLDIPRLDTVMFTTPSADEIRVKQSIARIERKVEDKKQPYVIDFIDKDNFSKGLGNKRRRCYMKFGVGIVEDVKNERRVR